MATPQPTDRRVAAAEIQAAVEAPLSPAGNRPAADPFSGGRLGKMAFGGTIIFGRVTDVLAYAHAYLVYCDQLSGAIQCKALAHSGLTTHGPRQDSGYTIGTQVAIVCDTQNPIGIILGAVPDWSELPGEALPDFVSQGSNVGLAADLTHFAAFTTDNQGGAADFSAGRPFDSLPGLEKGSMSGTGVGIMHTDWMAFLRADETTGVWAFYHDQMTRVAGRNLQIWSAGYEREDLDDEGEFSSVEGFNPYPWEVLGASRFDHVDAQPISTQTPEEQRQNPHTSRFEPAHTDLLARYRENHYHGYLGQGGRQSVATSAGDTIGDIEPLHQYAPQLTTNEDDDYIEVDTDEDGIPDAAADQVIGLADRGFGIDGTAYLRSSRGIWSIKYPLIAHPKRRNRPDSPLGDLTTTEWDGRNEAYAAAGDYVRDESVHVNHQVPIPKGAEPGSELGNVFDLAIYVGNWLGLHPFHYHRGDWYLPEESHLPGAQGADFSLVPDYGGTTVSKLRGADPNRAAWIDHRTGATGVHASMSIIAQLPNGGISIVDGFGSEIRMTGDGDVWIMAVRDLHLGAGRDVTAWAGYDLNLKGHNCVETTASWGSIRHKAEHDYLVVAGNSGCGGILLESRANGTAANAAIDGDENIRIAGVKIVALDSCFSVSSNDVYIRAGARKGDGAPSVSGSPYGSTRESHFVLDAVESNMTLTARHLHSHSESVIQYFLDSDGNLVTANEFWGDNNRLGGALYVNGNTVVGGCLTVCDSAVVVGTVNHGGLSSISVAQQADAQDACDSGAARVGDLEATYTDAAAEITAGRDNLADQSLVFEFRDSTYSAPSIREPIWHKIARNSGQTDLPVWGEPIVVGQVGGSSMPYPGYTVWSGTSYAQTDIKLLDFDLGIPKDRRNAGGVGTNTEYSQYVVDSDADATDVSIETGWRLWVDSQFRV